MKQSGYRTIFHIYLIFFLSLLGAVLLAGCLIFMTVSIQTPDGSIARSDWPKTFTEDFKNQIIFIENTPQIKQTGMVLLQDNGVGIQILDPSGCEVFSYQVPDQANTIYSSTELLQLFHREDKNIVRFLKELVIDILNMPEYEARSIHFESEDETVIFPFDQILFTRAFRNLIINAFVHGEEHTEVTVSILASQAALEIKVADNGKGMSEDVVRHLFDRYYRGTNTEQKPEGTGLGLAIAKGIIDLHGGMISVSSIPAVGTAFQIEFLLS